MIKVLTVFIFSIIFYILNTAVNIYPQNLNRIDDIPELLETYKEELHIKAMLVGIWQGERELLTMALGESMTTVPANTNMHFRIGGVSEIFLGTLLMRLVENGIVKLDDKISNWLPDLLASDKVTIGMLMKNTAGYKDYVYNQDFVDLITAQPFLNITREDIIRYSTSGGELNFEPGTGQKYSHTEFTILAEVLERASGKAMSELYEQFIFEPLDLKNTGYALTQELPSPVLHSFSSDRGVYEDATYWNPSWTGESGALYSTIHDLGKWAFKFGTGSLITPESYTWLVSKPYGAPSGSVYFASGFVFANGWYVQNPNFNGYTGAFGYLPTEELSIIVYATFSEQSDGNNQAFKILKELIAILTPDNPLKM